MLNNRRIISHICLVAVVGVVALAGVILSPAREVESDATITFTYLPGNAGGDFFLDATTAFGWTSAGEPSCSLGYLRSNPTGRIQFSADGLTYSDSLHSGGSSCSRDVFAQGISVGAANIIVSLNGNNAGDDDDDDDGYRNMSGYVVALTTSIHLSGISTSSVLYYSATATPTVLGTEGAQSVNVRYRAQGGSAWTTSTAQQVVLGAPADFALTGLLPETIYDVEAYLTSDPSSSQTATFTTLALPDPRVSTLAAQDITYKGATIAATITSNVNEGVTNATVLYLRYKRDGETDWSAVQQQPIVENGASFALTGLEHGSSYTVEVDISNQFSTTGRRQIAFSTLNRSAVIEPEPGDFFLNDTNGASFTLYLAAAANSLFSICHSTGPVRLEWSTHGSQWTGVVASCFNAMDAPPGDTVTLYLRGETKGNYRLGVLSGGTTLWYLGSVVDPVYDSRNIYTGVRPQIETDSVKTVDGNPRILDITIFWSSVDETDGYQVRIDDVMRPQSIHSTSYLSQGYELPAEVTVRAIKFAVRGFKDGGASGYTTDRGIFIPVGARYYTPWSTDYVVRLREGGTGLSVGLDDPVSPAIAENPAAEAPLITDAQQNIKQLTADILGVTADSGTVNGILPLFALLVAAGLAIALLVSMGINTVSVIAGVGVFTLVWAVGGPVFFGVPIAMAVSLPILMMIAGVAVIKAKGLA